MLSKVKIFAISIPRSTERYDYIHKHLQSVTKYDWEVIGYDGKKIRRSGDIRKHNTDFTDGEIGCALSHAEACRRVSTDKLKAALIVEDDVILPRDIDDLLLKISKQIEPGEVISIYNRTIQPEFFSKHNSTNVGTRKLIYPLEPRSMRTTAAYIIGSSAAKNIASYNNPVKVLADHWNKYYEDNIIDSIRLLYPLPVQLYPFESTIGYAKYRGLKGQVIRLLNHIPYSGKLRAIRRAHIIHSREKNILFTDQPSKITEQKNTPF